MGVKPISSHGSVPLTQQLQKGECSHSPLEAESEYGQLSRWEEHNTRVEDNSDVFSLGHLANEAVTD